MATHALHREPFTACHTDKEAAVRLADMHVAIAQAFVEVDRPRRVCPDPTGFQVVGRGVALADLEAGPQVHEAFSKVLVQWSSEVRWYPSCAAGWTGITAIELLWQFIFDTGVLPPFWYGGKWCMVDESVLYSCFFVRGRAHCGRLEVTPCWRLVTRVVACVKLWAGRGWQWRVGSPCTPRWSRIFPRSFVGLFRYRL